MDSYTNQVMIGLKHNITMHDLFHLVLALITSGYPLLAAILEPKQHTRFAARQILYCS
jgi:hypothetical protein